MAIEVLMPRMALPMPEGSIGEWKIKEGQPVKKDDVLLSVATDMRPPAYLNPWAPVSTALNRRK